MRIADTRARGPIIVNRLVRAQIRRIHLEFRPSLPRSGMVVLSVAVSAMPAGARAPANPTTETYDRD